jgi:hypothetical protein
MDMVKHDGYRTTRFVACAMISLLLLGCGSVNNCGFKPGVTVEQKQQSKEGETRNESEIESKLPVKVSPKGEFVCNF